MSKAPQHKILVVVSKVFGKDLFQEALAGYDLTFAHTPVEAREQLRQQRFQLILIDYHIPDINGVNLMKEFNSREGLCPPCIILLDEGFEKVAVTAMKEGASDYLIKDEVIPSMLRMSVTRAIEHTKWERVFHSLSQQESGGFLKDPETELYNKGYFDTRLQEEIQRSRRYSFPLTLVLMTVDQWETIDDRYGDSLNAVIKELGQLLHRNLRSSDLLARLKDDTFALLLPHTTLEQSQGVWERLDKQIRECAFTCRDENLYLTVRGALATLNGEIETIDALLILLETKTRQLSNTDKPFIHKQIVSVPSKN